MGVYAQIVLTLLKVGTALFNYFQQQKWINEGEALVIAKSSAEILRKSNYAKQALQEFASKSDSDVDDFLRSLEPGNDSK